MKKIALVVLILGALFMTYEFFAGKKEGTITRQAAIAVSKHTEVFNRSVASAMNAYFNLTEAFVKWDSASIPSLAGNLKNTLDSIQVKELKSDTSDISQTALGFITNAKQDVNQIINTVTLTEKKHSFNSLSDNIFQFLRVVKYDREKLYLQQCPMAFNDTEPGMWLSKKDSIRNPYMGLHHPRYGKGMLGCGDIKEVVDFTGLK